jgi:flavin-dependent dehydrogenase
MFSDVVVLGGGPAGSAAAISCAESGLRVALVERSAFPRMACGESLHPGVQPLLQKLSVEERVLAAGFLRYSGHHVRWGAERRFQAFGSDNNGPWLGIQAWRPTFDAILLERARDLGVTILQPNRFRSVLVDKGAVCGIRIEDDLIQTRFTIDATGRARTLSRALNFPWCSHGEKRRVWFGYAEGECRELADEPILTADSDGWTWVARVRPSVYQWTRLNFDNRRPVAGWLPPELENMRCCDPPRGADATWQIARQPAGPGYFLAGDAAAILDPASSHGVLKALMSGMHAGYLATKVIAGSVPEHVATQHYSDWVRGWFDEDVSRLEELYRQLPGWSANAVKAHAKTAPRENVSQPMAPGRIPQGVPKLAALDCALGSLVGDRS